MSRHPTFNQLPVGAAFTQHKNQPNVQHQPAAPVSLIATPIKIIDPIYGDVIFEETGANVETYILRTSNYLPFLAEVSKARLATLDRVAAEHERILEKMSSTERDSVEKYSDIYPFLDSSTLANHIDTKISPWVKIWAEYYKAAVNCHRKSVVTGVKKTIENINGEDVLQVSVDLHDPGTLVKLTLDTVKLPTKPVKPVLNYPISGTPSTAVFTTFRTPQEYTGVKDKPAKQPTHINAAIEREDYDHRLRQAANHHGYNAENFGKWLFTRFFVHPHAKVDDYWYTNLPRLKEVFTSILEGSFGNYREPEHTELLDKLQALPMFQFLLCHQHPDSLKTALDLVTEAFDPESRKLAADYLETTPEAVKIHRLMEVFVQSF